MSSENETPIDKIIREISADADAGNLVAWTPLGLRQLSFRIAQATMREREMLCCAIARVRELKARVRELKARVRELEAHADPSLPVGVELADVLAERDALRRLVGKLAQRIQFARLADPNPGGEDPLLREAAAVCERAGEEGRT